MRLHRRRTPPKTLRTTANIDIRPVTRAEAEAWRSLRLEMLERHPTAFNSSYEEWRDRDVGAFAARIPERGPDALFGAYVSGSLSGSAGFSREPRLKTAHKGVMSTLYVKPELRGRGLGEALALRVIGHAREHVSLLLCSVVSDNAAAGQLYGVRRLRNRAAGLALRGPRL